MSYRVEIALSGRAGCKGTECKDAGIKIEKGELRLGVWVEFPTGGSWVYRHWGCVTGKILENIRKSIEVPDKPGTYQWDMLDGYDSGDKNSLDKDPKLQEQVRRCITQGFIDPEDWNGDPEMNVLGAVGMRTKDSMRKAREDKKNRTQEIEDLQAQLAALIAEKAEKGGSKLDVKVAAAQADLDERLAAETPAAKPSAGKKRVKDEDDAEDGTPVKKKRATKKKVKAEEEHDEDNDVKPVKPAPKSRAKQVKKEKDDGEDDEEENKSAPAKKSRAKKTVKKEEDDDDNNAEEAKPAPAKKSRAKKAVKKEEDFEMTGTADDHVGIKNEDDDEPAPKSAPKKRAPLKKKATKAEVDEDADSAVKNEDDEESVKPAPKKRAPRGKKTVKTEQVEDAAGINDLDLKAKPATIKGRKKAAKQESDADKGIKDEPAAESSNPDITEGSSVLSEPQDLSEGVKGEPLEAVGVAPETEDVSTSAPATIDEVKNIAVPTRNRRTRSRTASNKV